MLNAPKIPMKRVNLVAEAAFRAGAQLVDRWDVAKWGLAAGFSLPETKAAWFAVDDFEFGRFSSVGVWEYLGIMFGVPTTIFGDDYDQAARFILTNGFKNKDKELIAHAITSDNNFPTNTKARNAWKPTAISALQDEDVVTGLRYLQATYGIDPRTVIAATRTAEILCE